jgi:hypothetical protein
MTIVDHGRAKLHPSLSCEKEELRQPNRAQKVIYESIISMVSIWIMCQSIPNLAK